LQTYISALHPYYSSSLEITELSYKQHRLATENGVSALQRPTGGRCFSYNPKFGGTARGTGLVSISLTNSQKAQEAQEAQKKKDDTVNTPQTPDRAVPEQAKKMDSGTQSS